MSEIVKSQHYVPRCYLKSFCSHNELIWAFDKSNENSFEPNIMGVAQENYFYDLPVDCTREGNQQALEKMFSKLESNYAKLLNKVILNAKMVRTMSALKYPIVLDETTKGELAFYVAIQVLRTKEFRGVINETFEKTMMKLVDIIAPERPNILQGVDLEVKMSKEHTAFSQANFITNKETISMLSKVLCNHLWVIGINDSEIPLITSDHPVSKHAHMKSDFGNSGYGSRGVELNFPLSPRLNLAMYEKSIFGNKFKDGCLSSLNGENVKFCNSLQVNNSNRFLYSSVNDFEIPKMMIKNNPKLKDINRSKVDMN